MHVFQFFTRSRLALLGLALALAIGCATRNVQQALTGRFQLKPGAFNQFSPEQDIQLGQQAAAEVSRTMPVLPDSNQLTQYIQQLGKTLAAHAPGEVKWPFSFHVINQKEINAFALPGGTVYVNLGTIQAANAVAIAPQSGVTEKAIGYGVIISGYSPRQGESLEQATVELVNNLRQSNPELRVAGDPKQLTVSGLSAMSVDLVGPSPVQGPNEPLSKRDILVAVQRNDGLLVFLICIAPQQQFQEFSPAFQQMLSSFRLAQQ